MTKIPLHLRLLMAVESATVLCTWAPERNRMYFLQLNITPYPLDMIAALAILSYTMDVILVAHYTPCATFVLSSLMVYCVWLRWTRIQIRKILSRSSKLAGISTYFSNWWDWPGKNESTRSFEHFSTWFQILKSVLWMALPKKLNLWRTWWV